MDYQENRSARLAGVAEYRKNNREKIRLFFSAFNKSPERIAYLRRHREEKKEHYQAMHREWCRNNRKRANERIYRYRRARALATPRWLSPEQKAEIRKAYISARKSGLTVDHIVPIQGKNVSGLHVPWNLQTLPLSDNCSKGRRLNE
jgi:5-methylcytosine-specific restriction endonuclease McrA